MIFTETYPAKVTMNQDPEQRGRIKVACSGILGDEETELPMWVEPVPAWGWFFVPDIGEMVEIEVVSGSTEDEQAGQASIDNPDVKWRGNRYYGNEEGEAPTPVNDDFKINYGKRRGFATPAGHTFIFDDTDDQRSISLSWKSVDGKFSFFAINSDGTIILGTHTGHLLHLNSKDGELTLIDQHGNLYSSDSDGSKIVNKDGTLIDLNGPNVQILAANAVTVSCKDATLDAGKVNLGGQPLTEAMLLGTTFVTAVFNAHTHIAGTGPTSTPMPADMAAALAALSTVVFGK